MIKDKHKEYKLEDLHEGNVRMVTPGVIPQADKDDYSDDFEMGIDDNKRDGTRRWTLNNWKGDTNTHGTHQLKEYIVTILRELLNENIKTEINSIGVDLSISERSDKIHIFKIQVPKSDRKLGLGTKAMTMLTDYADRTGKLITLSPSKDFGASSLNRLVKFYKRFGFVQNKGKHKDYTLSETMYRLPKNK